MAKRHARVKLSRAQKLENERNRWLARRDAAIEMLVKSIGKLKQLNRSVTRMERMAQLPKPKSKADALIKQAAPMGMVNDGEPVVPVTPIPTDDGLDIPAALDRRLNGLPDPRTKEKKAERRAVEKEVREAELTGKRRRMPLTGKDALAAIKGETPDAREARMASLGFRKTSKRK